MKTPLVICTAPLVPPLVMAIELVGQTPRSEAKRSGRVTMLKVSAMLSVCLVCLTALVCRAQAQQQAAGSTGRPAVDGSAVSASSGPTSRKRPVSPLANLEAAAIKPAASGTGANLPVLGSGTAGRFAKWMPIGTGNSFIGDSLITEDKLGRVGIGTDTPVSPLTVAGMIETTLGGYKFPDGTIQATAGLASIIHDTGLTGVGSSASPLGIAPGGVQTIHLAAGAVTGARIANGAVVRSINNLFDTLTLQAGPNVTITPSGNVLTIAASAALTGVTHDTSLTGGGSAASPLGVTVPLNLSGSGDGVVIVSSSNGTGVKASGQDIGVFATGATGLWGEGLVAGVFAKGMQRSFIEGGAGAWAVGGEGVGGGILGGSGVRASGGASNNGPGGSGIDAVGGNSGSSGGDGILATGGVGEGGAPHGLAARLVGDVKVTRIFGGGAATLDIDGNLNATGTKNFRIDHPLDPEHKYLYHAAIESSEVLNVYSGNVTTDQNGDAVVVLPDWFEALNRDFRYQLTVIGTFAQAIVAEKIKTHRLAIKTSSPNVEVSWQVTGVRSDPAMLQRPFKAEEEKAESERGYYLSPGAYGQPEERGIDWARNPRLMQSLRDRREQAREKARSDDQQH